MSFASINGTTLHHRLPGAPDRLSLILANSLIAGENDLATPPQTAWQLAEGIAGAEFRLIRGAGHVPSIEQPERLWELICEHLREVVHA